jgi:hypothetical protein
MAKRQFNLSFVPIDSKKTDRNKNKNNDDGG